MRRLFFLALLLVPTFSHALNISSFWVSDGGDKIPREVFYPHGAPSSTTTITTTWDGRQVNIFSARGETAHFMPVMIFNSGSSATNVMVTMSSMTCDSGDSIVSVAVSSLNVTDTTTRPIQVFSAWDNIISSGMSNFPYGRDEYEERQYPEDMRVPCTITAGHCIPDGGTDLWVNRPFHYKHLPVAWIPIEEYAASSQTFTTGTSHSYFVDIYVSSNIPATQCHGALRAYEGATLSTSAPVELKIYNFVMPATPSMTEIADVGNDDTTGRLQGVRGVSQPLTGNNLAAVTHVMQLLKAHNVIGIGDNPDSSNNDFPSQEYNRYLNGSAFTSALGYGNARGINTPSNFYMIGTYSSGSNWNGAWSQTNATTFSTVASSYAFNIHQINPSAKVGLYGQDEVSDQTSNEKWATWLSTNTSWTTSTHINMFITADLVKAKTSAPHANYPASTNTFGNGTSNSSTTWQNAANAYQVGPDSAVWRYNGGAIGQGMVFVYEDNPYIVEANYWGYWQKLCPNGVCSGGHFDYESNYWRNADNPGGCSGGINNDLDLFNDGCTFGYRSSTDTVWGEDGFQFSQGDGVLIFPGTDFVYANPSFGFNGAIATVNLKAMRQGVDDVDIINAAYAINPSSTTALIAQMYPQSLWSVTCFDPLDCTYSYGDRSWSYGPNNWVNARQRMLIIASSGSSPTIVPQKIFTGHWTLRGGGVFR